MEEDCRVIFLEDEFHSIHELFPHLLRRILRQFAQVLPAENVSHG